MKLIKERNADEDVVAAIEELLQRAKAGTINSIAIIETRPGGDTAQSWAGQESIQTLIGAAHMLLTTLTLSALSGDDDDDDVGA